MLYMVTLMTSVLHVKSNGIIAKVAKLFNNKKAEGLMAQLSA